MVKIGEFVVPVTAAGELWLYVSPDKAETIYFSPACAGARRRLSRDKAAAIEGSIVFVGTSAAGLQDIRTTALGQNVPGVSLHAQTVEQILSGRFLARPDWADGLEILSIAVAGSLLVILTTFVSPAVALACGLLITVAWRLSPRGSPSFMAGCSSILWRPSSPDRSRISPRRHSASW